MLVRSLLVLFDFYTSLHIFYLVLYIYLGSLVYLYNLFYRFYYILLLFLYYLLYILLLSAHSVLVDIPVFAPLLVLLIVPLLVSLTFLYICYIIFFYPHILFISYSPIDFIF